MNIKFFDDDNAIKYYVLGWILSDGHIVKNRSVWTIDLHNKDRKMLEKIQTLLGITQNKIYGPYKDSNKVQFRLSCKEHYQFLTQSWGLDNYKSKTLKWKDCPVKFLPHIVRGYFDGDGSIYTKQSANPSVNTIGINFVGTHHFINGLRMAINKANDLPEQTGYIADLLTYASLVYNGAEIALKILDWMYLNSTELTRLDRKFQKYIEYKKYINESIVVSKNKSTKYKNTIIPDYELSQQIRFDYEYLGLNTSQLSKKYNVNRSTINGVLKNITHTKSDNRTNHAKIYIQAFGETKHLLDWVNDERCVVNSSTLRDRIVNQKLQPEKAITSPPDSTSGTLKHIYEIDGEQKTISEIIKDKEISRSAFIHRVEKLNMDPVHAANISPGYILPKNQPDVKSPKPKDTILITYQGKTKSIKEWSEVTGLPYSTIGRRYRDFINGKLKSIDKVLTTNKLEKIKTKQSDRDKQAHDLAFKIRSDYKNGLIGKALCEKYNIPKSRAMDILANRTCKEDVAWWRN